jgi:hypothetical protein
MGAPSDAEHHSAGRSGGLDCDYCHMRLCGLVLLAAHRQIDARPAAAEILSDDSHGLH